MTTYVVLQAETDLELASSACSITFHAVQTSSGNGVELRAVPARNWTSGRHTLKAETQRKRR